MPRSHVLEPESVILKPRVSGAQNLYSGILRNDILEPQSFVLKPRNVILKPKGFVLEPKSLVL